MRHLAIVIVVIFVLGSAPGAVAADNQPPVAADDPAIPGCIPIDSWGGAYPIVEDATPQYDGIDPGWNVVFGACSPLANDTDPDGDPLTIELVGQPAHGQAQWLPEGFLQYKPDPHFSTLPGNVPGGNWVSDAVAYRVSDGQATSEVASYRFWVAPVNDPPSFTPGADIVTAYLGDGAVSVPWATEVSAGPPNEAHQTVSFEITDIETAGVPNVFAVDPSIDSNGVLHFTTGSAVASAEITVRAHDDGGLETWGTPTGWLVPPDDTTDEVTFAIVIKEPPPAPADTVPPTITAATRDLPNQALPGKVVDVNLAWAATDTGSGVATYRLQERIGDGAWHGVALATATARSAIRPLTIGTTYRYRVRAIDLAGNFSAWTTLAPITPKRVEQTSTAVRWSGTWTTASDDRFSGGSARRTSSTGRRAVLTFTGQDIGWLTMRSTVGGRAQVRVDGILVATVDVDAAATAYRRLAWTRHLKRGGTHTLEIRPLGDGRVTIDAFVVLP
jgi:hypothetical protein